MPFDLTLDQMPLMEQLKQQVDIRKNTPDGLEPVVSVEAAVLPVSRPDRINPDGSVEVQPDFKAYLFDVNNDIKTGMVLVESDGTKLNITGERKLPNKQVATFQVLDLESNVT